MHLLTSATKWLDDWMGWWRALLERQTLDHNLLAGVLFGHLWDGTPLDGLVLSNTKSRHHDYGSVSTMVTFAQSSETMCTQTKQRQRGGARDGGKTKNMFNKIKQNHRWIIRETSLLLNFSVWQLSYIKVFSVTHRLLHRRLYFPSLLSFTHSLTLTLMISDLIRCRVKSQQICVAALLAVLSVAAVHVLRSRALQHRRQQRIRCGVFQVKYTGGPAPTWCLIQRHRVPLGVILTQTKTRLNNLKPFFITKIIIYLGNFCFTQNKIK